MPGRFSSPMWACRGSVVSRTRGCWSSVRQDCRSPALIYLAAAGVGTIGVADPDVVELSNLQRQVVHGDADVGRLKSESAAQRLASVNPLVRVVRHDVRIDSRNALQIIAFCDLVLDGTDNFPTRYLLNDACVLLGKPDVWGSIDRFDGQASIWWAKHGPCHRCVFPEPPPPGLVASCDEGGVLGVVCPTAGSTQALEAVKLIVGIGDPLVGRLTVHDALRQSWDILTVHQNPDCAVCGQSPTVTELVDYEAFCPLTSLAGAGMGDGTVSWAAPVVVPRISALELADLLSGRGARGVSGWSMCAVPRNERLPGSPERGRFMLTNSVPGQQFRQIPLDLPVVLFCRAGVRSQEAADPDRGRTPGRAKPAGWGARVGPRRRPRPAQILSWAATG
jgi:sulfur-carrier protein adenylyltransferase/sulfurtransferase